MKPETGNWVRKQFKRNKVWVATDKNGRPLMRNNKVLIKYQLDQDHEYWVKPENVQDLPQNNDTLSKPISKPAPKPVTPTNSAPEAAPTESKNEIVVFTDGASSGNPGPSGIGVFLRYGNHEREISRYIGHSTNNIAELTAILTALQEIKRKDLPVRIYTDSSYACGLLINGWKAKKNISLVNAIRQLMTQFKDLKIIKIKGHSGLDGNEKADQLATSAITAQKDVS